MTLKNRVGRGTFFLQVHSCLNKNSAGGGGGRGGGVQRGSVGLSETEVFSGANIQRKFQQDTCFSFCLHHGDKL